MNPARILIVEDEVIVAMDVQQRLAMLNYQVVGQASTGERALALAKDQQPDLVLMDIRLRGEMDGVTAARQIRDQFHLPVVFLTAYAEEATLQRAKLAEPYGYLLKPFEDRELRTIIEMALYKHQTEEVIRRLNDELEEKVRSRTAELEAANRELEAFSYSISHDLRAPLRAIDGFTRLLAEEYAAVLPPEARRYQQLVRDSVTRMGHLIDDLLRFARLGRQAMYWMAVNSEDLVRGVLQEMAPEREGRTVRVTVHPLPACHGDPSLLKQVWTNLIANAFKYSRKREVATIEIGCRDPEPDPNGAPRTGPAEVVFYVRDNGAGFDMKYSEKLFGVFQRLHRAEDFEGTGVGLAIVQRVIHRHGGRVWAEAAVDQGATFYFSLPVKRNGGQPPGGSAVEPNRQPPPNPAAGLP